MKKLARALFVGAITCLWIHAAPSAIAQPAPDRGENTDPIVFYNNAAKNAALFDFTYGPPQSPVLPLVGVEGDQITRLDSFQKFGLSLFRGLETSGAGPALALDFSPYWMLTRDAVSLRDYRGFAPIERVAARAKASIAVSEGNEDDGRPSSLILSIASKLLRASDPLLDTVSETSFEYCIKGSQTAPGELWRLADEIERAATSADVLPRPGDVLGPNGDPESANAAFDAARANKAETLKPRMEAAYRRCVDRIATQMALRPSFDFGAGIRMNGTPGGLDNLENSGAIVWATYATGAISLGREREAAPDAPRSLLSTLPRPSMRGVLHVRYTFDEAAFDDKNQRTGEADAALVALGLESVTRNASTDRFRWSLQGGWNRQDAASPTSKDRDYWRYLANVDTRVMEGIWISGTLGRVEGDGIEDDTYATIALKFSATGAATAIQKFYEQRGY